MQQSRVSQISRVVSHWDAEEPLLSLATTKKGWSPIQIVLPILTAIIALFAAGVVFLCWRRAKTRPHRRRYWEDANLQGPRRFFGLFPDVLRVRKQTADTHWEIDDPRHAERDEAFSPPEDESSLRGASTRGVYDSRGTPEELGHSRTTSLSSLLPTTSRTPSSNTNMSGSVFSNFLSIFSWSSSSGGKAKYKKGVAKAPEYKRVNVVIDRANERFKIDGEPDSAGGLRGNGGGAHIGNGNGNRGSHASRATTLPSVLDIRLGPRADGSPDIPIGGEGAGKTKGFGRSPVMYGTVEEDYESAAFSRPPRSDFTLTTNDLMTPTGTGYTDSERGHGAGGGLRPPSPSVSVSGTLLLMLACLNGRDGANH